ncbi:MAG: hypothetical protein L0207_03455 [Chlamydiae bacterium]|nr:hypothetical protein [Chlamydiota bacterium]
MIFKVKNLLLFLFFALPIFGEVAQSEKDEFVINLKDPVFVRGVLKTDQGGVITAPGLRIQAKTIEYTHRLENGILVQKIVARGDLMMEYQGRAFVASQLEYDLTTKTGFLCDGKTSVDIWFFGGEKIELRQDGSFIVYGGYITTCESQDNTWEIKASTAKVVKGYLLSAKDIRFHFIKIPIFWLPSFKSNLRFLKDPPIRYKILWDKGIGPRLSMRYRVYSWEQLNAYLRFDYRIKLGPGGALETDYRSEDMRTVFQTKTYGAYDKSVPNEKGRKRYRIQGLFHRANATNKTQVHLQWDKMSDERIISDFKSEDFEINTQKRNYFSITHEADDVFANIYVEPRLNRFQSMSQQLPYFASGIRSIQIWKTGIISENYVSAAYLDYTFATEVDQLLMSRKSGRVETKNQLYRPFSLGPVVFTPGAGISAIFYSNNPNRSSIGQLVLNYGANLSMRLTKQFSNCKHLVQPYIQYFGLSRPQAPVDDYFVFDIDDGFDRLDQVRVGVRNALYIPKNPIFLPRLESDLYLYGFFGARSFDRLIPRLYASLALNFPSLAIKSSGAWNFEKQLLDFFNIHLLWTINARFALGMEYRHRSKLYWRKADYSNFVMDFARPVDELLISPLSDKRNTLITKAHIRFSPRWDMHIETRHGWGRSDEPRYNQLQIDLLTMLTCSYQLKMSFKLTPNNWEIAPHLNLIK